MSSRQTAIPRTRKSGGIREGRAPLGGTPAAPAAAERVAAKPAAAARRSADRQAAGEPQAVREPQAASAAASAPATRPRPKGTKRVLADIQVDLAEQFRDRARQSRFRFSQTEALTGALTLLAELDDAAYEELLLRFRD